LEEGVTALSRYYPGISLEGKRRKTSVAIAGVLAEIKIEHLQNTSMEALLVNHPIR
jgi:hypothetical protein